MSEGVQKQQNVNEFNKFLQNNKDFLQQKYDQYFKKATIATKDLNRPAAVKFIYDVFSFSKYQSDQKMNNALQKSLTKNIQDFLGGLNKKKLSFNNKSSVELLKFCIENNDMFAVKYDKKDKKMKTQQQMGQSTFTQKQQATNGKQNQREGQQEKQEQQEQSNKQKQNHQVQKDDQEQEQEQEQGNNNQQNHNVNEFQTTQKQIQNKPTDPQLIKKNLKLLFQFYCKQQQNVGANTTFDRISYECKTMTLGKFLAFATSTQIVNDKIDKNLLMRKFKLIAEGKKQIQFQQFYQIMLTLASIDQATIPKLGVDQKISFKNKMKERTRAFNTKDLTSRQPKREYIFVPKLTQHSGKPSQALHQQMQIRKNLKHTALQTNHNINQSRHLLSLQHHKQLNLKTSKNIRYDYDRNSSLKKESQIIASPTQINSSYIRDFEQQIGFLQKIINMEQGDQEWLRQYKIPHKKASILPPKLMSRKESIVPNMRKRVQQLQRSETRQTVHLQKRHFMSDRRQRQRNVKSILS